MNSHHILLATFAQTWQVAFIAVLVWMTVKLTAKRQPHLAHLLWGIVLLKAVTPPVLSSPTGIFNWLPSAELRTQQSTVNATSSSTSMKNAASLSALSIDLGTRKKLPISSSPDSMQNYRPPGDASKPNLRERAGEPAPYSTSDYILIAWLTGSLFMLAVCVIRSLRFWHSMKPRRYSAFDKNSSRRIQQSLQSVTRATAVKLRMRQDVRVTVVDAAIGPAVVGLWRPRIILPLKLVRDRSRAELEPLIAHELIHVRRGDLFWALLQSLATNLLWFHPFVWIASKRLTLESERCCDEQTIARLGCSPRTYALALVDVLDRKHQLHSAPVLPGVRPVDVTRDRLERIMKLGQGSRRSTPAWAWAIFGLALIAVLPGAATVVAQSQANSQDDEQILKDARGTTLPTIPMATSVVQDLFENARIDVSDLLGDFQQTGMTLEQAKAALIGLLPQRTAERINSEELFHRDLKISRVPKMSIEGGTLHMFETKQQVAKVRELIEERRRYGFDRISLEIKMITVSKQFLNELGIRWQKAASLPKEQFSADQLFEDAHSAAASLSVSPQAHASRLDLFSFQDGSHVVQASSQSPIHATPASTQQANEILEPSLLSVPATQLPAFFTQLPKTEYEQLIQKIQSDSHSNILQAPRVTFFSGQSTHISDTVQRPFVTGVLPIVRQGKTVDQPIVQIAVEGLHIVSQCVLGDDGDVELLLAVNEQVIGLVESFTFDNSTGSDEEGEPLESGVTIQIPELKSRFLALKTDLQAGDSLVVTNGVSTLDSEHPEHGPVVLVVARILQTREFADVQAAQSPAATEAVIDQTLSTAEERLREAEPGSRKPRAGRKAEAERLPLQQSKLVRPAQAPDIARLARKQPPLYLIGPGDILGIQIDGILPFAESGNAADSRIPYRQGFPITVLEDGSISLPLLQPLTVDGSNLPEIRKMIGKAYLAAGIVEDLPKVTVGLLRRRQHRVHVWRLDRPATPSPQQVQLKGFNNDILNALMASGGLPKVGSLRSIQVVRAEKLTPLDADRLQKQLEAKEAISELANAEEMVRRNGEGYWFAERIEPLETGDHLFVLP